MTVQIRRLTVMVILAVLMVSSTLTGGCTDTVDETVPPPGIIQEQIIEDITTDEAYTLIQENEGNPEFEIIDVRTPEEFTDGHIEDAVNLDFNSGSFREDVDRLNKDKTYLIYCRSGRRSAGARDVMAELGFREVYNMEGGIIAWEAKGFAIVP